MTMFTGLGRYTRSLLHTSRWTLVVWIVVLAVITVATGTSIAEYYGTVAQRASYARALEIASVMESIGGASGGLDQLGGIIANEIAVMVIPGLAIAGVMLAVGRTRKEEDLGRTELLTAKPVGRLAPLAAAWILVTASLLVNAVVTGAMMVAFGSPLVGAEPGTAGAADGGVLAYGLLTFAYSVFFAGVGFVAAELADNSRTATTVGIGVFIAAFMIRVYVNGSSPQWRWLTPVGWFDQVAPFAQMRWLPLGALLVVGLVLYGVSAMLRSRRDVGAGVIRARGGRESAPAWLGTPLGITWRLTRTNTATWLLVSIVFALLFGTQLEEWLGVLDESNALITEWGISATAESITQLMTLVCAIFGGAVGITQLGMFHREEQATRVAYLLSKPVARTSYFGAAVGVAVASAAAVTLVSGAVFSVSAHVVAPDSVDIAASMGAMATVTVPVLLCVSLAALGVGVWNQRPWLAWLVYGAGIVIAFLGEAMRLPDWARELGIFNQVGLVPVEEVNWLAIIVQAVIASGCGIVAIDRFAKREIVGS